MARVLVTGAAGFIGYHTAQRLLARGDTVIGVDDLNDYYDVRLKEARLARLQPAKEFYFHRADIADRPALEAAFDTGQVDAVIHLAAQAGVRHSLTHPHSYASSNLVGFLNVLEACRHRRIKHLTYASSSSVYGANGRMPFSEQHGVDHPVSLYAATKRAGELMAHTYSHLYDLPTTGLRFFTVYGPWGRPDMSAFLFARAMLAGEPIDVFNGGDMRRDFTYVDDIVEGVVRVSDTPAAGDPNWHAETADPATSRAPFRIFNIGHGSPVPLLDFIGVMERELGVTAQRNLLPMQPGDVPETYADTSALERAVGYRPTTSVEEGVRRFVAWYRDFYRP